MSRPVDKFLGHLAEVDAGRRGFIPIPDFIKAHGGDANVLRMVAESAGYIVERHGRYGWCVFPTRTTPA